MDTATTDQFAWYKAALKGTIGPIQESNPQSGFFEHYLGYPVAIWRDNGAVLVKVDDALIEGKVAQGKVWISVAKTPRTYKAYQARVESGEWPATLPPVPKAQAEPIAEAASAPAAEPAAADRGPGDNSGTLTDYQRMREEILGDVAEARTYLAKSPIADKDAADKASDWADRIAKAAKAADKARDAEKAPLWTALKEIEAKWQDIIKPAEGQATALRNAANEWGRKESERLRREAEAKAKAEWEAAQAELRKKREAEAAERARQAAASASARTDEAVDADGVVLEPEFDLPPAPPPKPVVEAPKVMVGTGAYGNRRTASAKAPETATIMDLGAVAAFYAQQKHPELVELLQKLANRAIKARAEIPGVRFSWQQKSEAAE